jgi:hypothetical protein
MYCGDKMQGFSNFESGATVQLSLFLSTTLKTQETRIILTANFVRCMGTNVIKLTWIIHK